MKFRNTEHHCSSLVLVLVFVAVCVAAGWYCSADLWASQKFSHRLTYWNNEYNAPKSQPHCIILSSPADWCASHLVWPCTVLGYSQRSVVELQQESNCNYDAFLLLSRVGAQSLDGCEYRLFCAVFWVCRDGRLKFHHGQRSGRTNTPAPVQRFLLRVLCQLKKGVVRWFVWQLQLDGGL